VLPNLVGGARGGAAPRRKHRFVAFPYPALQGCNPTNPAHPIAAQRCSRSAGTLHATAPRDGRYRSLQLQSINRSISSHPCACDVGPPWTRARKFVCAGMPSVETSNSNRSDCYVPIVTCTRSDSKQYGSPKPRAVRVRVPASRCATLALDPVPRTLPIAMRLHAYTPGPVRSARIITSMLKNKRARGVSRTCSYRTATLRRVLSISD
jgi:hypothetical protein